MKVTVHAIQRYRERVKPALDYKSAARELEAVLAAAPAPTASPPEWLKGAHPDSDGFVELSDGIVGGISGGVLATVLIRGSCVSSFRALKNEIKSNRRAKRKKPPMRPGTRSEAKIRWK